MQLPDNAKIAYQFSGGKDSLAGLFLLKPWWDRLTVYWLNSGDAVPEVEEFVREIADLVPNFVEVEGCVREQVAVFGPPTDLLAADASWMGAQALGHTLVFQDRNSCCFNSLMRPLQDRMKADGVEVIIRGQKLADKRKSAIRSGAVVDGVMYLFPLEGWTDADVVAYLERIGVGLPSYYQHLRSSPDCLHCTAYLDEQRKDFLQASHPEAWQKVAMNLRLIRSTAQESLHELNTFLGE